VRRTHFPDEIGFDYPQATEVLSTTKKACSLDCAHCGGHYLEGMIPLQDFAARKADEDSHTSREGTPQGKSFPRSCLISGGCDSRGKVPFLRYRDALAELKKQCRLNFHVGLVDEDDAAVLGQLADTVSFDFVGDDETITEVFGLRRTVSDYLASYRALRRHTRVLPHICVGLRGGRLSGEYRALEILAREGIDGLVTIIFSPTPGTRYADRTPPPLDDVARFLATARLSFPNKPFFLGCMRPNGRYRAALDCLAVECGLNKLVQPTPGARRLAAELGLRVIRGEECCAL
jgi:uncharacterized radical SAM superfamily protein